MATEQRLDTLVKGDIFSLGLDVWHRRYKFDRMFPDPVDSDQLVVFIASLGFKGQHSNHFTHYNKNQIVFKH